MTDEPNRESAPVDAAAARREQVQLAIRALQAGRDPEANFRLVFESYHQPLQRFFVRKGFSQIDSLDLTQETFLGIFRGLEGLRDEARFEAWLYKVATTTYLKRVRAGSTAKRSRVEVEQDEASLADPAGAETGRQLDGLLEDERRRAMQAAIEQLPQQMRQCMTLRVYHELAYREIAKVMKIKIDTVKAHLFQGRAKLKELLKEYSLEGLETSEGAAE